MTAGGVHGGGLHAEGQWGLGATWLWLMHGFPLHHACLLPCLPSAIFNCVSHLCTACNTCHSCYSTQADLDLGNYERFMDITLSKDNNLTTGKIYSVRRGYPLNPSCRHRPSSAPHRALVHNLVHD